MDPLLLRSAAAVQGVNMDPKMANRLANHMHVQSQQGQPTASELTMMARQGLGPRGIDVNSYAGSMWNGTAVAKPGYVPQPSAEAGADRYLTAKFGPSPAARGQIDIAGANGVQSVAAPAPITPVAPAPAPAPTGSPSAYLNQNMGAKPFLPNSPVGGMLTGSRLDGKSNLLSEQIKSLQATGQAQTVEANRRALDSDAAARSTLSGPPAQDPAMAEAQRVYQMTGQVPQPGVAASFGRMDPYSFRTGGETPTETTVDRKTGQVLGSGVVQRPVRSPEEEARAAGLVKEAQTKVEDSTKFLGEVSSSAEAARVRSSTIGRILSLYDAGATSGFGQDVLTGAQAAFARLTGKPVTISNQQELEKNLANLVLETGRELMKGSGAVTDYERTLIEKATANAKTTPQANKQILGVMKGIAERQLMLDRKRIELDEQGMSSTEIAKELRKIRDTTPVDMSSLGGNPADAILSKYGIGGAKK